MKRRLFQVCVLLLTIVSAAEAVTPKIPRQLNHGYVLGRGVVTGGDDGLGVWLVEYNSNGDEVEELAFLPQGLGDDNVLMSADSYRSYQQRLADFRQTHEQTLARGSQVISRLQFNAGAWPGERLNNRDQALSEDSLERCGFPGAQSVLLKEKAQRFSQSACDSILLTFPVNLVQSQPLPAHIRSLVINRNGYIRHLSQHRIGLRSGFFGRENRPVPDNELNQVREIRRGDGTQLYGPINNAIIRAPSQGVNDIVGASANDGFYTAHYVTSLCPGFSYNQTQWLTAEIPYRNLLPTGGLAQKFYMMRPIVESCQDFAALFCSVPAGLPAANACLEISDIEANQANVAGNRIDFLFDIVLLQGGAVLQTPFGTVPVGEETEWGGVAGQVVEHIQPFYDLDEDGVADTALPGRIVTRDIGNTEERVFELLPVEEAETQGIYLSSQLARHVSERERLLEAIDSSDENSIYTLPDLFKAFEASNTQPDEPIGLISQISRRDLSNTDIYVFRDSTGELLLERRGVRMSVVERGDPDGDGVNNVSENEVTDTGIAYRIKLRGNADRGRNLGALQGPGNRPDGSTDGGDWAEQEYAEWASDLGLTPAFQRRNADHLTPGEVVRIIAINRTTGYVGSVRHVLQGGSSALEAIPEVIQMRPPNLRVWAERKYTVEHGWSEGENREYIIGQEGSGTTGDTEIVLYTEWLDADGSVLPTELGRNEGKDFGLRGRLAKIVSTNNLAAVGDNQVADFGIKPGRHAQVITLPGAVNDNAHFYLHVIGRAVNQECLSSLPCPDFEEEHTVNAYQGRPRYATPVIVPVSDQTASLRASSAFIQRRNELFDDLENPDSLVALRELVRPGGRHRWAYRPEYQFSIVGLEIEEINRQVQVDRANGVQIIEENLLENELPLIFAGDLLLEVLFSLQDNPIGPNQSIGRLNTFDSLDSERYQFSLNGGELLAQLGAEEEVVFDDLSVLGRLRQEGVTSLRLLDNYDAGNILWEFDSSPIFGFPTAQRSIPGIRVTGGSRFDGVVFKQAITLDRLNDFVCASKDRFSVEVHQPARVTLKILRNDTDGRDEIHEELDGALLRPGYYVYALDTLPEGVHGYELTGENLINGRIQQVRGNIQVEASDDPFPLGQTLVEGVNMFTGNLALQRSDVAIKSRGAGLHFRRTFSSGAGRLDGPLGPGWGHSYETSLSRQSCGAVTVRTGDQSALFFLDSEGGYRPAVGYHSHLEFDDETGDYDFYAKDGTRYHFSNTVNEEQSNGSSSNDGFRSQVGQALERERDARIRRTFFASSQLLLDYIESPYGHRTTLTYGNDRTTNAIEVSQVEDEAGRVLSFEYEDMTTEPYQLITRRLKSIEGPDTGVTYEYNEYGQLVGANVNGADESYEYNFPDPSLASYGLEELLKLTQMTEFTDPRGAKTGYEHETRLLYRVNDDSIEVEGNNFVKTISHPQSASSSFTFDDRSQALEMYTTEVTNPRGLSGTYTLQRNGLVEKFSHSAGDVLTTWNLQHALPSERTDERGVKTVYEYDDHGNAVLEQVGDLPPIRRTFETRGDFHIVNLLASEMDRNQNITRYSYNEQGSLTGISYPEGLSESFGISAGGDVETSVDKRGTTTTYGYDAFGNVTSITAPDRGTVRMGWDARNLKILETDGNGNPYIYENDARGFVSSIQRPSNGGTIQQIHDPLGNKVSETDPLGRVTTWEYDLENRLTRISRPDGSVRFMGYDLAGNMTSETDWNGNSTGYGYNEAHHRTLESRPRGLVGQITPDPVGNVLSIVWPEGRFESYSYDDLNRQTSMTTPRGTTQYNLDGNGNMVGKVDVMGRRTSYSYDGLDRLRVIKRPENQTIRYSLDGNGNVQSETDGNGNVTTRDFDLADRMTSEKKGKFSRNYGYDNAGNLISETDRSGRNYSYTPDALNRRIEMSISGNGNYTETYEYDTADNLIKTVTPVNTLNYGYDDLDRLTETNDDLGIVSATAYDPNGNEISRTNGRGLSTTLGYDELNYLTNMTEPGSRITRYVPDIFGNVTSVTDPNGNVTTHFYNTRNEVEKTEEPVGTLNFSYDDIGNRLKVIDARGFTTSFSYDDLDRLKEEKDALGQTITRGYDRNSNLVSLKDKRGITNINSYDAYDRLIGTRRGILTLFVREYEGEDNIEVESDANGNITSTTYDVLNNPLVITRPLESVTSHSYNNGGQRIQTTDAEGRVTTYAPDARGRNLSETFQGLTTSYSYDGNNNQTGKTRPNGNSWQYSYDVADNLKTVSSPTGTTIYDYDKNNNRTSVRDAKGFTTAYEYDTEDRLIGMTYVDGEAIHFGYDDSDNLISTDMPNGSRISASFDEINRETSRAYTNGSIPDGNVSLSFGYDPNNNQVSASSEAGTESCGFDFLDRKISKTDVHGQSVAYDYDGNGNRLSVSSQAGTTRYSYDALNRLTGVSLQNGQFTSYSYDKTGLKTAVSHSNGVSSSYAYDAQARISGITNTAADLSVSSFSYSYDNNSNRLSQQERYSDEQGNTVTETTLYSYDNEDRLNSVSYCNTVEPAEASCKGTREKVDYEYDDNFNRISEVTINLDSNEVTSNKTLGYNNRNQLTQISDSVKQESIAYEFDPSGNQTQKTKVTTTTTTDPDTGATTQTSTSEVTTFVYNAKDELKSVTQDGTTQGGYVYDHNGMRTSKQGERGEEKYTWDQLALLLQTDSGNNITAHYEYGSDRLITLNESGKAGQVYLYDALGSPVSLIENAATLSKTATYQYDAWGNKRFEESTSFNRIGFTGHEEDKETGLIYAKQRYLDPDTGRFLNNDPFEGRYNIPPSLHRYLYAYGNPFVYYDPDGREATVFLFNQKLTSEAFQIDPIRTIDTGLGDAVDIFLAGPATVANGAIGLANGVFNTLSLPVRGAAALTGVSTQEIEANFTALEFNTAGLPQASVSVGITKRLLFATVRSTNKVEQINKLNQFNRRAQSSHSGAGTKVPEYEDVPSLDDFDDLDAIALTSGPAQNKARIAESNSGARVKGRNISRRVDCRCCFVAGTLVYTKDGFKRIEEIKLGDLVASKDEKTGEIDWKPVSELFKYDDDRITHMLTLKNEVGELSTYEVTDNHPFWVVGKNEWVDSGKLEPGMIVMSYEGNELVVKSLRQTNESPVTYNFEVADFHTYFVGKEKVWVHNQCCEVQVGDQIGFGDSKEAFSVKGDSSKVVLLSKEDDLDSLVEEVDLLSRIEGAGAPIVKVHGIVNANGRPGILKDAVPDALTLKDTFGFGDAIEAVKPNLGKQALADLEKIRKLVEKDEIVDFQLLVPRDGSRVFVDDPAGFNPGQGGVGRSVGLVDELIGAARANTGQ